MVTVNITVSWGITPCTAPDFRRFGEGVASIFRIEERTVQEISSDTGREEARIGALSETTSVIRRAQECLALRRRVFGGVVDEPMAGQQVPAVRLPIHVPLPFHIRHSSTIRNVG